MPEAFFPDGKDLLFGAIKKLIDILHILITLGNYLGAHIDKPSKKSFLKHYFCVIGYICCRGYVFYHRCQIDLSTNLIDLLLAPQFLGDCYQIRGLVSLEE